MRPISDIKENAENIKKNEQGLDLDLPAPATEAYERLREYVEGRMAGFVVGVGWGKLACWIDWSGPEPVVRPATKDTEENERMFHRTLKDVWNDVTKYNDWLWNKKIFEVGEEVYPVSVCLYLEDCKIVVDEELSVMLGCEAGEYWLMVFDNDGDTETELAGKIWKSANFRTTSKSCKQHSYYWIKKNKEFFEKMGWLDENRDSYIHMIKQRGIGGEVFDIFMDAKHFMYEKPGELKPNMDWFGVGLGRNSVDEDGFCIGKLKRERVKWKRDKVNERIDIEWKKLAGWEELRRECDGVEDWTKAIEVLKDDYGNLEFGSWRAMGIDLSIIFQDNLELGCKIFCWWSERGYAKFEISQPIKTFLDICNRDETFELRTRWKKVLGEKYSWGIEDWVSNESKKELGIDEREKVYKWLVRLDEGKGKKWFFGGEEIVIKPKMKGIRWGKWEGTAHSFLEGLLGGKEVGIDRKLLERVWEEFGKWDGNYPVMRKKVKWKREYQGWISKSVMTRLSMEVLSKNVNQGLDLNLPGLGTYRSALRDYKSEGVWLNEYGEEQREIRSLAVLMEGAVLNKGIDNAVLFGAGFECQRDRGVKAELWSYLMKRDGDVVRFEPYDWFWEDYKWFCIDEAEKVRIGLEIKKKIREEAQEFGFKWNREKERAEKEEAMEYLMECIYYQSEVRIGLPAEQREVIMGWLSRVAEGTMGEEDFPYFGLINNGLLKSGFEIRLDELEIVDIADGVDKTKKAHEVNRENGKEKRGERLKKYGLETGKEYKTKELNEIGIGKNDLTKFVNDGWLVKVKHGVYKVGDV